MARKKINPALLIVGTIGGIIVINAVVKTKGERLRKHLMTYGFGQPISYTAQVPPGKKWLVDLRNGDQVLMNSTQLQNAIESHAVKTYREVPLGFVGPGGIQKQKK